MQIYRSIYLTICLFVCLFVFQRILIQSNLCNFPLKNDPLFSRLGHLPIYPCTPASIHPCINPFFNLSIFSFVQLSSCPSILPSIHPSRSLSIHLSIYPSIYLSTYLHLSITFAFTANVMYMHIIAHI